MNKGMGDVSDMATNTVLMNGVVGPALHVVVTNACAAYNWAVNYFTNTYCQLVIEKLPIFTTALDDSIGYVDVALQTVNDFMDIIMHVVLPQALVAMVHKGYTAGVSSLMFASRARIIETEVNQLASQNTIGKLSKAVSAIGKETTGGVAMKNAIQEMETSAANMKATAQRPSGLSKYVRKTLDAISAAAGPLGKVMVGLEIGLAVKGMIEMAEEEKRLAKAIAEAPKLWTMVDFTQVRVVLRDLTAFLTLSSTPCLDPPKPYKCPSFSLPNNGTTGTTYAMPQATMCWADAQVQEIGTSNLYACSPSSTCMVSSTSGETMICAECPLQQSSLYVPFGCDVMQQRCACNILSTRPGTCTTNSDCGDSGFCSVLGDVGATSFGVNMCSACATPALCIVQTAGSPGSCTCLRKSAPYQLCDASSIGKQLIPAPPLLELYSVLPVTNLYGWGDSAFIPASQVRTATCVQTTTQTGQIMTIALAVKVFQSTVSQTNRRLLADVNADETIFTDLPDFFTSASPPDHLSQSFLHGILSAPGWNSTASPCSTVVLAYQQGHSLSAVDEHIAHTCAYWRHIGRIIIRKFNMTALQEIDTFLLSADDMASAMAHKGVWETLILSPRALITAAMYSSWLKPIRAAVWLHYHDNINTLLDNTRTLHKWGQHVIQTTNLFSQVSFRQAPTPNITMRTVKPEANHTTPMVASKRQAGRRLLQATTDVLNSPYYYIFTKNIPTTVNQSDYVRVSDTCLPAQVALTTGMEITHVMGNYYSHFNAVNQNMNLSTSLWDSLPKFFIPTLLGDPMANWVDYGSYSGIVVRTILSVVGVTMDNIVDFFTSMNTVSETRYTFNNIISQLTSCDYAGLTLCAHHSSDFFSTIILAILFYMLVNSVMSLLGIPFVSTLLFYSLPLLVLWYSYGVSPMCFPMVPPCFADDILSRLNSLFPAVITIPPSLQCTSTTTPCLVSCTSIGFDSWQDPLAYAAAAWAGQAAELDYPWLQDITKLFASKNWTANVIEKINMVHSPEADAYTTCAFVTAVSTIPALVVVIGILVVATSVAAYALDLVPLLIAVIWNVAVVTSADEA